MSELHLNALQRAWLKEIGIDARMLQQLSPGAPQALHGAKSSESTQPNEPTKPPQRSEPNQAASPVERSSTGPSAHPASPSSSRPSPLAPAGSSPIESLRQRIHAPRPDPAATTSKPAPTPLAAEVSGISGRQLDRISGTDTPHTLASLHEQARHCTACGLHEVRGQAVFGEGVASAPKWMFIGEAPGEYDDSVGKPFQGRPGELLQAMLAAIGCAGQSELYFTNVLKCRPLGSRIPEKAEVEACMPFLREQIRLLQPRYLVALGRVAASALLGADEDLDALRGRVHTYRDGDISVPVVVTHHPAALLLHGRLKADAWRDLNLLRSLDS